MSAPSPSQSPTGPDAAPGRPAGRSPAPGSAPQAAAQPAAPGDVEARTFRLQRSAYLIVLFLAFCVAPLAFASSGAESAAAGFGPRALLMLIPVLAAVYIARTATVVDARGVAVRALLGSRRFGWDTVRGLTVDERAVYIVLADGAVRLPCVRIADLAAVTRASGGRLPQVAEPRPKSPPTKRRR